MKRKRILLWIVGFIITISAAVYQKKTGPTYPKKEHITINEKEYVFNLIRSHPGDGDALVKLEIDDENINALLYYRNYPVSDNDMWQTVEFKQNTIDEKKYLMAHLPHQKPAGKLLYYIQYSDNSGMHTIAKEKPIVIRYRGDVPAYIMIPHIIFIFLAMFLANVSGLFAAFKIPQFRRYTSITLLLLLFGGMIFGPIVQKFAFNEFWAGIPKGWDLTDNKTLIAFVAWVAAFILNLKKGNRAAVIIASLITIIIFSIPHSMFGSELNRETGKVIQGFIQLYY